MQYCTYTIFFLLASTFMQAQTKTVSTKVVINGTLMDAANPMLLTGAKISDNGMGRKISDNKGQYVLNLSLNMARVGCFTWTCNILNLSLILSPGRAPPCS
ncbi:hypothetical protein ABIB50_002023 [Mucilaginibacter sp. UYCu711]